jgi:AraC family transcriptional regulator
VTASRCRATGQNFATKSLVREFSSFPNFSHQETAPAGMLQQKRGLQFFFFDKTLIIHPRLEPRVGPRMGPRTVRWMFCLGSRQYTERMLVLRHDVFFGDLKLSRGLDGVTVSHRIANSPPQQVPVHTHTDAHFVLITSGDYVSSATGDAHPRSTLIFNPPGTKHRDHFWQGRGSFFAISLSCAQLSQSLDRAGFLQAAVNLRQERAIGLAWALLMECVRWNPGSQLKAESLCLELLSEISVHSLSSRPLPPSWLPAACDLIRDCPDKTPHVRDLAKTVGVHAVHLARAFRTFIGCTPGDLLRARRLELAAGALMKSEDSLAEIALAGGFSDQAQFTKAFHRMYGVTPGAYRQSGGRNIGRPSNVAF